MHQKTTASDHDQPVLTRGLLGKHIFGELLQFISAPSVLTFDGKPYDDSQAEQEYITINIDGKSYGYMNEPDPGFNTSWFNPSDNQHVMTDVDIAYAKKIDVVSGS